MREHMFIVGKNNDRQIEGIEASFILTPEEADREEIVSRFSNIMLLLSDIMPDQYGIDVITDPDVLSKIDVGDKYGDLEKYICLGSLHITLVTEKYVSLTAYASAIQNVSGQDEEYEIVTNFSFSDMYTYLPGHLKHAITAIASGEPYKKGEYTDFMARVYRKKEVMDLQSLTPEQLGPPRERIPLYPKDDKKPE